MLLNGSSGEGNMQISFWSGEKGKWGLVVVAVGVAVAEAEARVVAVAVVVAEAEAREVCEATTEMVLTVAGAEVADDKGVKRIELSLRDERPRIQHQIWKLNKNSITPVTNYLIKET